MSAPTGNRNRAKSAAWADAIKRVLNNYESLPKGIARGQALEKIACALVESALDGDKDAIKEIGERLDGKSVARIDANVNFFDTISEHEQLAILAALDAIAADAGATEAGVAAAH